MCPQRGGERAHSMAEQLLNPSLPLCNPVSIPHRIHSIILSLLWKVFLLVLPAQSATRPAILPLLSLSLHTPAFLNPAPPPAPPTWVFIQLAARERVEQSRSQRGCFDCVLHSVRHLVDMMIKCCLNLNSLKMQQEERGVKRGEREGDRVGCVKMPQSAGN